MSVALDCKMINILPKKHVCTSSMSVKSIYALVSKCTLILSYANNITWYTAMLVSVLYVHLVS